MLGHVYVVEDAKDLAQIVRDVTRYGGAYRPEACIFIYFFSSLFYLLTINPFFLRMCMNLFKGDLTGRRLKKQLIKRCIV